MTSFDDAVEAMAIMRIGNGDKIIIDVDQENALVSANYAKRHGRQSTPQRDRLRKNGRHLATRLDKRVAEMSINGAYVAEK